MRPSVRTIWRALDSFRLGEGRPKEEPRYTFQTFSQTIVELVYRNRICRDGAGGNVFGFHWACVEWGFCFMVVLVWMDLDFLVDCAPQGGACSRPDGR